MLVFFLRHRSRKVCKNPFSWWAALWQCPSDLACVFVSMLHALALAMVRGEPNEILFEFSSFFHSLDLSNAFMDSHAHYLAPFLMCASVAPREKVVWSVREKGPEPGGNCSQLRARISQLPSPRVGGQQTSQSLPYVSIGSAYPGIWTSDQGFQISPFSEEAVVRIDMLKALQAFCCLSHWATPRCTWCHPPLQSRAWL